MKLACLAALFFGLSTWASQASPETATLDAYDTVAQALAGDDLAATKTSATTLAALAATAQPAMASAATKVAESATLEAARKNFKAVSLEAVKLAAGREGYYIMTCPMVSADWVQKTQKVHNPYMGKAMLECGFLKTPQP